MTLIVMDSGGDQTPLVLEWTFKISSWGMSDESDIEVSERNLKKIEEYLDKHPQGTCPQSC